MPNGKNCLCLLVIKDYLNEIMYNFAFQVSKNKNKNVS